MSKFFTLMCTNHSNFRYSTFPLPKSLLYLQPTFSGQSDCVETSQTTRIIFQAPPSVINWRLSLISLTRICPVLSTLNGLVTTSYIHYTEVRGSTAGRGTALQVGRSRVRFPMVSLEFFIDRNVYQEYFQEGKGDQCVGLTTLPPSCAECLEIWEPQLPGTRRACPGLEWNYFTFIVLHSSVQSCKHVQLLCSYS